MIKPLPLFRATDRKEANKAAPAARPETTTVVTTGDSSSNIKAMAITGREIITVTADVDVTKTEAGIVEIVRHRNVMVATEITTAVVAADINSKTCVSNLADPIKI